MKILVFSPWPPQHTGIADYAYDLVSGLCELGLEITLVTESENPRLLEGLTIVSPDWCEGNDLTVFDKIIYQVGNNSSFHIFMLPYLFRYGGIIHLHDMVLHHLMAYILYLHGNPKRYWQLLNKWYGPELVDWSLDLFSNGQTIWDSEYVAEIPLFEEVLQYADACIVHSEFARKKIRQVFPNMSCHLIPQVYNTVNLSGNHLPSRKKFSIGIFGGVEPNKRLGVVLDALSDCTDLYDKLELHIVGKVHEDCLIYSDVIKEKQLENIVFFHGRLSEQDFLDELSNTDLCVALRHPTMGETSAVVMRALQYGIPVIVSDNGWYSELPDFIPKIVPGIAHESDELATYIRELIINKQSYKSLKSKVEAYSETTLNYKSVVSDYLERINS